MIGKHCTYQLRNIFTSEVRQKVLNITYFFLVRAKTVVTFFFYTTATFIGGGGHWPLPSSWPPARCSGSPSSSWRAGVSVHPLLDKLESGLVLGHLEQLQTRRS